MGQMEALFSEYKENLIWISQMDDRRRLERTIKEWEQDLRDDIAHYHRLIEKNTQIVSEMMEIVNGDLTDELAEEIFEETKQMYDEYLEDGYIMLQIFHKLISFYENKQVPSRLVLLHSYAYYMQNDVLNLHYNLGDRDNYHAECVLKYQSLYTKLEEEARFRIFAAYYNLIIAGTDSGSVSIDQAFDYYHQMLELWNSKAVQELDGENEKIKGFVEMLIKRLIVLEIHVKDAKKENRDEFCTWAKKCYQEELEQVSEPTEMDMMVYIAFLRSQILSGEKTLEENFDSLVSYYRDQCYKMQDANDMSEDDVFYLVRTCTTLVDWSHQGIPKEKADKVICDLLTMLDTKWKKFKYVRSSTIDDLMCDFVKLVLSMPFEIGEKERYAFEFGIRRQITTFMNSVVSKNIAAAFLREILKRKKELFDSLSYMNETELYHFVEQCALLHNLGNIDYISIRSQQYRRLFPEEWNWIKEHTERGVKLIQNQPELQKYRDVILYHHKSYDGKTGFPENEDCLQSPTKIVTDLISLVDFIDEYTNPLVVEAYQTKSFEDCLKEIKKGRGTKFHPDMVDILEESLELQEKIQTILSERRLQIAYSIYHSFDVGAPDKEKEQFLQDTLDLIQNAGAEELRGLEQRLDQLFVIAENNYSSRYMGLAYYAAVRFYERKKDSLHVINNGVHALRYLHDTKEYLTMAKLYNLLGIYSGINGDQSNAISYFLHCADCAGKTEDTYGIGAAYYNIANIFKELNNPVKALEYIEKAEPFFGINPYLICYLICYKGYYACKLDLMERAKDIREQLLLFIKENPEYPRFIVNLFLAVYAVNTHEEKQAKEYLLQALDCDELKSGYREHTDEQDICYDLLFELGMYDELIRLLDVQLEICEKEEVPYHLNRKLLRKAIDCVKKAGRSDQVYYYGEKLDTVFQKEDRHKIDLVLESEYSAMDNIAIEEKHKEILNDNYRLKEGLKHAEHANEAKNAFLSSMSHEIRTPIHAVLGLDEMILRETGEEQIKQYAIDIQTAGKTLLGLINDILDFSKLEAGKMELIPEEYSIKELVRELDNMIASRASQKQLDFRIKMNTAIPCGLYGDDLRIKQIILNLLTNAVKYTENGCVTFSVDFEKRDPESIILKVVVEDTGIGLKPEDMEKLSRPFERFDEKRNRTIEGTGLGMSIVTNLLKQMNSNLRVESTYGVGSSFSFELEQKVVDWAQVGQLNERNGLLTKKKTGPLFVAPKAKILVVDDTAVNLTVVKGLLKRNKVQLTLVRSGKECLECCQKEHFHLILLDHRMPEMDGVETLHYLKDEAGLNSQTPVIALTANAISGAYDYYKKEGFDDLVIKPVNGRLLEEKIIAYLPKELTTLT